MTAVVVEQTTGGWRSPLPWTLLARPSPVSSLFALSVGCCSPLCCMCIPVIPGPRGWARSCSHQASQTAHRVVSRAHSQVWGLEALAGGCEQTARISSLKCGPHTPAGHTQMWYTRVTPGHRASPPVTVTQLGKPRASAPVVPVEDIQTVAWARSLSGTVRTCPLCRARLSLLLASRCLRDGRPLSRTLIVLPAGSSHTVLWNQMSLGSLNGSRRWRCLIFLSLTSCVLLPIQFCPFWEVLCWDAPWLNPLFTQQKLNFFKCQTRVLLSTQIVNKY